jgi:hypothetical protein
LHLTKLRGDCALLALVEEDNGSPVGIVPMRKSPVRVKFEAGGYPFTQVSFSGIQLLGGHARALVLVTSPDIAANDVDERVSVVMVRKGLINQSLIAAHRFYERLLAGVSALSRCEGMASQSYRPL